MRAAEARPRASSWVCGGWVLGRDEWAPVATRAWNCALESLSICGRLRPGFEDAVARMAVQTAFPPKRPDPLPRVRTSLDLVLRTLADLSLVRGVGQSAARAVGVLPRLRHARVRGLSVERAPA